MKGITMEGRSKVIISSLLIGLAFSAKAYGQHNSDQTRTSLRGLEGVFVSIHYDAPPEAKYGLTQKDLRDQIDLRLNADGVTMLTKDKWFRSDGQPYLYVNVVGTNVLNNGEKSDLFFFAFSTELMQRVKLERTPHLICDACTWSQGYSAIVPKRDLRSIAVRVGDLASEFAHAMNAANAKSTPG